MIASGRLRASRIGSQWAISPTNVNLVRDRQPGRPKGGKLPSHPWQRRQDWRTPTDLFQTIQQEFALDLDAAAADDNHLLPDYFTRETDGLAQSWAGRRVYVNPPFQHTRRWVEKALREWREHDVLIVMLLPSRTGNAVFQELILPNAEVRFLPGRLRFDNAEFLAPFDTCLVILRPVGEKGETPRLP